VPIVSSQVVEDRTQADGRRRVRERHVDHLGVAHDFPYLAGAGDNVSAAMAARVATIEAQLKANEIAANVAKAMNGETGTFTFTHSTVDENLAALREVYRTATKWEVVTIGHVLHEQALSNARIDTLFGTSGAAGRTAVRDRLAALDVKYHDVISQAGG
jgi:hypothetical protein